MNPAITKSLELLSQLSATILKPYKEPNWRKLVNKRLVFHNLQTGEIYDELPESAAVADFEWQCSYEGATMVADIEVSKRKPFCGQFIGLSGSAYVWFGDGENLCYIGEDCSTLVVHNIAADRPMIAESYNTNTNLGINFFCTMSAHVLTAGISGQQTWAHTAGEHRQRSGGLKNLVDSWNFWSQEQFPEVLNRHANRGTCSIQTKEIRDIFFKGTAAEIDKKLVDLMNYGFEDVRKTLDVFQGLYPAWIVALPSIESQYFYLKRSKVNYSLSDDFVTWFHDTEDIYQKTLSLVEVEVEKVVQEVVKQYIAEVDSAIPDDLENTIPDNLREQFFTKTSKYTKLLVKYQTKYRLALDLGLLDSLVANYTNTYPELNWKTNSKGLPAWAETEITSRSPNFQLLLKPTFRGNRVSYSRSLGFFSVDSNGIQTKVTSPKKGLNTKDNCGSLFSKDFVSYWDDETFKVESELGKEIVSKMATISYWTSVRTRLAEIVAATGSGNRVA